MIWAVRESMSCKGIMKGVAIADNTRNQREDRDKTRDVECLRVQLRIKSARRETRPFLLRSTE